MLTLGIGLAGIESSLGRHSWRNPIRAVADYLNALARVSNDQSVLIAFLLVRWHIKVGLSV
jgi:hypothetical protein